MDKNSWSYMHTNIFKLSINNEDVRNAVFTYSNIELPRPFKVNTCT